MPHASSLLARIDRAVAAEPDVPAILSTWHNDDGIPHLAYRASQNEGGDVWREAIRLVAIVVRAYQAMEPDRRPSGIAFVTLPHVERSTDEATGWAIRGTWLEGIERGTLERSDFLARIASTKCSIRESALLEALGGLAGDASRQ